MFLEIGGVFVNDFMLSWRFLATGYLILINLATFLLFGVDKRRARRQQWRIPEATLLTVAVLGGSIGAILAMQIFRHKTKHPKFLVGIPVILILQVVLIGVFCVRFGL